MGTPVTPWRSRAALARSGLRSQTATSLVFSICDRTRTWVCPTVLVPITAHRHCLAIKRTPSKPRKGSEKRFGKTKAPDAGRKPADVGKGEKDAKSAGEFNRVAARRANRM